MLPNKCMQRSRSTSTNSSVLFLSRRRMGFFIRLLGFLVKMRMTLWTFFLINHLHHQPRQRTLLTCLIIPNVVKRKPFDGSTFVRNEPQSFLDYSQLPLRSTRDFEMPFCLNQDPCGEQIAKDLVSTPSVPPSMSINLYIIYSNQMHGSNMESCQYREASYLVNSCRFS